MDMYEYRQPKRAVLVPQVLAYGTDLYQAVKTAQLSPPAITKLWEL